MLENTRQKKLKIKNTDNTQIKSNPEKANNAKHRKTKLAWFSHLLEQSVRKRGGLIRQRSQAHTRLKTLQLIPSVISHNHIR